MRPSSNVQIFIGALAGIGIGCVLNRLGPAHPAFNSLLYVFDVVGGLFIGALKMIIIPLIFSSITIGIANLRAHAQMGRVWKITMIYFVGTMALAVLLGLILVNIVKPGIGLSMDMFADAVSRFSKESVSFSQFVRTFTSSLLVNPFAAMAQGQILPTIIFAMFLGVALVKTGERSTVILKLMNEFFDVIMLMVGWIMRVLPLGLLALLAKLTATQNVQLLGALGKFMALVTGATLFHGLVVLPAILWMMTGRNPVDFLFKMRTVFLTAFSTSSSSATIPVTLRCVEEDLKVNKDIAGFVIPLGATINMDGTALYEAIAALFVANLAGIHLSLGQQLIVFFTSIVAAIGAPGIPSAGMVTMIMVLQSVGLPVEAVAILIPIDRPLDTIRTVVNVEGDAVGSCIVDHLTHR